MTDILKRLFGEVPQWATRKHPLLRYEIHRTDPPDTLQARLSRIAGWVTLLTLLLLGGYIYATNIFQEPAGVNITQSLWRVLVYPALGLQLVLRVAAISLGVGAISDERRRQTWDNLRATERGAALALRTRMVAIFYRLRGVLIPVLAVRGLLIGAMLYELTSMRGEYLQILANNAQPSTSLLGGVALLAALMTAAFVLPLTGTGVDAAFGLAISSAVKNRALAGVLQVLYVVFRVVTTVALWLLTLRFFDGQLVLGDELAWGLLAGGAVLGDWGLSLLQLQELGTVWSAVPYSIFIPLVLVGAAMVQAALIQLLLRSAIRAAERYA